MNWDNEEYQGKREDQVSYALVVAGACFVVGLILLAGVLVLRLAR